MGVEVQSCSPCFLTRPLRHHAVDGSVDALLDGLAGFVRDLGGAILTGQRRQNFYRRCRRVGLVLHGTFSLRMASMENSLIMVRSR